MIDIKNAKQQFIKYVSNFDMKDERIRMKKQHTFYVAKHSKRIAKKIGLNKEYIKLAELIGILHDIGRFEQVEKYNTFKDNESINHGELGVKILFEDNMIRKFIKEDKYDNIIRTAILNHNRNKIEEGLDECTLIQCKIIRDADKTDIFRVLNYGTLQRAYGTEYFSKEKMTDTILDDFFNCRQIVYANRKTQADMVVCHIAYIYDFNYKYGLKIVKKKKYIKRLLKRFNFEEKDTIENTKKILEFSNKYIENRLKED